MEALLSKIRAVLDITNETSDGTITAWCPFHPDGVKGHGPPHKPNFQLKRGDKVPWVWNCVACDKSGGSLNQLADCLWDIGLLEPDGHYEYTNEGGKLEFQIIRWPVKEFHARRPGAKRGWHWNLDGVMPYPYHLPQLQAADRAEPVFIVEGEGDVETLEACGLVATTNALGAGKWQEYFSAYLVDRIVVILPDRDQAGDTHAVDVLAKLGTRPASVRILKLPGLVDGGDVTDWMGAGGTKEKLLALVAKTPVAEPPSAEPGSPSAAEDMVERLLALAKTPGQILAEGSTTINWVLQGVIAPEVVTLIVALGKGGKTTLGLQILRAMAQGRKEFLGLTLRAAPTLYLTEERRTTYMTALLRAELEDAENPRSLRRHQVPLSWEEFAPLLLAMCRRAGFEVVFVDTTSSWWDLKEKQENDTAVLMVKMAPLLDLAAQGVAVVMFHHMGKAGGGEGKAVRGGGGFVAGPDIILELWRVTGQEKRREIRSLSRFDETPDKLVIEMTLDGYRAVGQKEEVTSEVYARKVWAVLSQEESRTRDQLSELSGLKKGEVSHGLRGIASELIERTETGKAYHPYLYRRLGSEDEFRGEPLPFTKGGPPPFENGMEELP